MGRTYVQGCIDAASHVFGVITFYSETPLQVLHVSRTQHVFLGEGHIGGITCTRVRTFFTARCVRVLYLSGAMPLVCEFFVGEGRMCGGHRALDRNVGRSKLPRLADHKK